MMTPVVEIDPGLFATRRRLFAALTSALGVSCVTGTGQTPSGRVVTDGSTRPGPVPTLVLGPGSGRPAATGDVDFTAVDALDPYLRSWRIPDRGVPGVATLSVAAGDQVLATVGGEPVWIRSPGALDRRERAVLVPDELDTDDTLRARLVPGRYLDLLPLVSFLRTLHGDQGWRLPPVAASFVMDDPNLHSTRYGYLDLERLSRSGRFHLTLAMIPFDRWLARRGAVELVRSRRRALSLMMHGNNHTRHELADGRGEEARLRMLAQALRRVRSFGSATGIPIAEVMVAPHGRCSEESARDMARLGFESMCISRPFPWLERPPASHPNAGWAPADTSAPTPVLPRFPVTTAYEELPLRAFLRQPLVLSGHHWDIADEPDRLEAWSEQVARLGDIEWASVGSISRAAFSTRVVDDLVVVRPHTRVVEVTIPPGIASLSVEAPPGPGYELVEVARPIGTTRHRAGERRVDVGPGERVLIRLVAEDAIDPGVVPDPRWSPWPPTRRLLTEMRDRVQPRVDALRR